MLCKLLFLVVLTSLILAQNAPNGGKCGNPVIKPNIGNTNISDLVVGGTVAIPYSWPWQIVWCEEFHGTCSLQCGGTVIGTHWVMTAGHCVYGSTNQPGNFWVKTGVFDESKNDEASEKIHKVKSIHLHPKYKPNPDPQWDISLIEMEEDITFGDYVQPICLPKTGTDIPFISEPNSAWGTGWGSISENGDISRKLRQVNVPFVNYKKCEQEYGKDILTNIMICAGVQGKDTCQGDSGGPLQQQNKNGHWFQYGITSWGNGCAEARYPGVYSRTAEYCDFILNVTKGDVKCQDPSTY
uniref:limulus clotting factor C n=1 Tax=Acrobeloides nanus TaxID=290746 RepID=A0A914DUG9_9BILA